ncbi:MAG: ComEC family competence protein [Leptolyngbya sp. SIO4C1]|nr:ComEC family competence protein [Leptolyngbya sp. SIO4C1]
MTSWALLLFCSSYLLGLLSTGLAAGESSVPILAIGSGLLILGIASGIVIPKYWRLGPTRQQWIVAGLIGTIGAAYCVWRIPQPATNDVSRFLNGQASSGPYEIVGEIRTVLQPARNGDKRFFLAVESVRDKSDDAQYVSRQPASGRLYVTAPSDRVQKLHPDMTIKLGQILREPEGAQTPGSFDLKRYLAKQGSFAKLRAAYIDEITTEHRSQPGLWQLRQRIAATQGRWLKAPKGSLLSAMTLGRRAVDLPYEIRDSFVEAGLAHTLAASGFHVSLVLGLVLAALRSRRPSLQFTGGTVALLGYIALTGLQPSVMRAGLMGFGALIGLILQRQVKPLGCLFFAINLLLLYSPQWIWDAGFQLSAFATLGLIVSVSPLVRRLDWMPAAIATMVAAPLAAYVWTIPLQLYHFGVVPSYSILLNVLATQLVTIISIGGFLSAFCALVWPLLGSAIAWLMTLPIQLLIWLVEFFNQLPGNQLQVGNVSAWQVILSYAVYAAVSLGLAYRQKSASV